MRRRGEPALRHQLRRHHGHQHHASAGNPHASAMSTTGVVVQVIDEALRRTAASPKP